MQAKRENPKKQLPLLARTQPIYKIIQRHRTHKNKFLRKELFNAWSNCSSLSIDLQFLSFHTVHKMHNETALQTFLLLLPIKDPCHPKRVFLTIPACSQRIPNRVKSNYGRSLTLVQWRKMWPMDSSLTLKRKKIYWL